jgi:hypothetical protein
MKMELNNINLFKIKDEKTCAEYWGCNQAWYKNIWKQKAGCGPCAAGNIFMYLFHEALFHNYNPVLKSEAIVLMDEIWRYVTPSVKGVNSTKIFYEGAEEYAGSKGFILNRSFLDIPQEKSSRPELHTITDFIARAIAVDSPIAFLNLCNGEEKRLYRWHWVTITSIDSRDGETI